MNTTLKNETADIYDKVICVTNRHCIMSGMMSL